jgi:hypothetical protein
MVNKYIEKLIRGIRKTGKKMHSFLYKPIPIFVFHQIGEDFNPLVDYLPIWTSMDLFKKNIEILRKNYKIISLEKAVGLMCYPIVLGHYAVITFDDGYQSTLNAVEYLIEKKVPCTWFINSAYLDQKSFSIVDADIFLNHSDIKSTRLIDMVNKTKQLLPEEEYLALEEIILNRTDLSSIISKKYISKEKLFSYTSPYLSIGMHGHRHWDARNLSLEMFKKNIVMSRDFLNLHSCFVPFFALPYGQYTQEQTDYLINERITTLLCDNDLNHTQYPLLSRYCADGKDLSKLKLY